MHWMRPPSASGLCVDHVRLGQTLGTDPGRQGEAHGDMSVGDAWQAWAALLVVAWLDEQRCPRLPGASGATPAYRDRFLASFLKKKRAIAAEASNRATPAGSTRTSTVTFTSTFFTDFSYDGVVKIGTGRMRYADELLTIMIGQRTLDSARNWCAANR